MEIKLNREEIFAFMDAAARGKLETDSIPRIVDILQDGKNTFLELMKALPDDPEQ